MVGRCVPESRAPGRPGADPAGVASAAAALIGLLLPLIQGREAGWPAWTWASLAASAAAAGVFVRRQHRQGAGGGVPLVDLRLFRHRAFAAGLLAQLVFWLGQASFFLVLALYLQQGRGLDPLGSGLLFTSIGAGYLLTSTRADLVAARLGRRAVALGALLMAGGLAVLAVTAAAAGTGSVWWLAPGLFADGLGMGLALAPLTAVALAAVPPRLAGSASGVVATVQQVAGALGIALIGLVFFATADVAAAFRHSVAALAALELVLAALVRLLPRHAA
ncbi:MFS transporter [Kitasatospora sp. NPDC059571]|uniref:MFS transporter n=1 Tax=Kitasatospora sp. NPDC059571 TaxID=3346871 RepID=UPI0036A5C98B